jgi:hypothetical protein
MRGRTITSFPQGKVFVSGERLLVNTLHANASDTPWELPTPQEPSPLRYELRSRAGERAYRISHDDFVTLLRDGPPDRSRPPQTFAVEPGAKLIRGEDIAELSTEPFAPGAYFLVSRLRHGEEVLASPPAPLQILAPRIEAADAAYCLVRGNLASALAHRFEDGRLLVLARESYRRRPSLGVFHRVAELGGEAPITDLRVFVDTADLVGGRWIAWVREGRVHARKVWGASVEAALEGVGPAWDRLRLVGPGFQRADASGLLFVVGEAGGQTRLAELRLSGRGAEILSDAPLPGAPESLAATWTSEGVPWLVGSAAGAVHAWSGAEARTLGHLVGPLAAWSVPAVTRAGPTRLALLEGPSPAGGLRLHRASLDGRALVSRDLPAPVGEVARWDLLDAPGATWVLAVTEGRLLSARAEGTAAFGEVGRALGPAYLRSYLVDGVGWAEWQDPELGLRRVPLPP